MKKGLLFTLLALSVGLVFGVAQASAWQRDPDRTVDAALLTTVITQLLAPDSTIGDTDTTAIGVGTDAVGIDDSLTSPPPDPADNDPGHTYYVDNTPTDGDCPAAAYTTIQAGVDASGPGDTVKVCPGTYVEQVRIVGHNHDKLKLESLKPLQAVIQWPTLESSPRVLVDFNSVDHVTLRGFTVTGPFPTFPPAVERHEGLLVENAFDEHIHHNHITEIRDINPTQRGNQEGDAVAIGRRNVSGAQDVSGSAHVDHNLIDEYQKNGIQAVNSGTFVHADHNVVTGPGATMQPYAAPNGIGVFRDAVGKIDHNIVSDNHFATPLSTGIFVAEDSSGSSEIDHNKVHDNDFGIETDAQSGLEIDHNDVFQNVSDAITLCGDVNQNCFFATDNVVRHNKITDNGGSGILLLGADANLLKDNEVTNNGTEASDTTDGLRVDSMSSDNEILNNKMHQNVTHDCHDDSVDGGTGGTANTWKGDEGDTQNHDGLCKGAMTT